MNRRSFVRTVAVTIGTISVGGISLLDRPAKVKTPGFNPNGRYGHAVKCMNTPKAVARAEWVLMEHMKSKIPQRYHRRVLFHSQELDYARMRGICWEYDPNRKNPVFTGGHGKWDNIIIRKRA